MCYFIVECKKIVCNDEIYSLINVVVVLMEYMYIKFKKNGGRSKFINKGYRELDRQSKMMRKGTKKQKH